MPRVPQLNTQTEQLSQLPDRQAKVRDESVLESASKAFGTAQTSALRQEHRDKVAKEKIHEDYLKAREEANETEVKQLMTAVHLAEDNILANTKRKYTGQRALEANKAAFTLRNKFIDDLLKDAPEHIQEAVRLEAGILSRSFSSNITTYSSEEYGKYEDEVDKDHTKFVNNSGANVVDILSYNANKVLVDNNSKNLNKKHNREGVNAQAKAMENKLAYGTSAMKKAVLDKNEALIRYILNDLEANVLDEDLKDVRDLAHSALNTMAAESAVSLFVGDFETAEEAYSAIEGTLKEGKAERIPEIMKEAKPLIEQHYNTLAEMKKSSRFALYFTASDQIEAYKKANNGESGPLSQMIRFDTYSHLNAREKRDLLLIARPQDTESNKIFTKFITMPLYKMEALKSYEFRKILKFMTPDQQRYANELYTDLREGRKQSTQTKDDLDQFKKILLDGGFLREHEGEIHKDDMDFYGEMSTLFLNKIREYSAETGKEPVDKERDDIINRSIELVRKTITDRHAKVIRDGSKSRSSQKHIPVKYGGVPRRSLKKDLLVYTKSLSNLPQPIKGGAIEYLTKDLNKHFATDITEDQIPDYILRRAIPLYAGSYPKDFEGDIKELRRQLLFDLSEHLLKRKVFGSLKKLTGVTGIQDPRIKYGASK